MTAPTHPTTPLKVIDTPQPGRYVVFETPHEKTLARDVYVMTVEPNPSDDPGECHVCGSCSRPLIRGPVEGRIDPGIVIQCPQCQAYNKATDD
jgi:hypothetical protein